MEPAGRPADYASLIRPTSDYVQRGKVLVILLCGGDKGTQKADIKRAHELAKREG